ncbi:hypothetical protein B4096_1644 [Heyndrickxia coagulans]|nr:hypothetical protein B4096_1644 [Heyndrickxia coagulans]
MYQGIMLIIQVRNLSHGEKFIEEIRFEFNGDYPQHDLIEELVNHYLHEKHL